MHKFLTNYGENRSLEPKGSFPTLAWKLDTKLPITENEMLIRVGIINVNDASFKQLRKETHDNPMSIANKIISIVKMRGKLHNPVTGTGGTLYGTVNEIGRLHPAYGKLKLGTGISTLISTKFTPLVINSIKSINMQTGQIEIDGYAILSEKCLYTIVPEDIPLHVYQAIATEAGHCYKSALNCKNSKNTLVIGAASNTGLLSLFAIKEKIGTKGKLIAITDTPESEELIKNLNIVNECYTADMQNPLSAYYKLSKFLNGKNIDYTVDCETIPGHETLSILLTQEHGTIYFSDPATSVSEAGLAAEGIGKDLNLLYYHGYINGHMEFCENLIRKYPSLKETFTEKYSDSSKTFILSDTDNSDNTMYKNLVINSPSMKEIVNIIQHVAPYDTTVLITGSSGSGKEVIANLIQQLSSRKSDKFIKINCAAISDSLFESEFFGYESGAFTGALKGGKAGYFESANNGTLFLDEIGELSLENQVKLLRVLQNNEVMRVGGNTPIKVNVRIIAATNKNLFDMVNQGTFRGDLYYRLNVVNLHLPALKNRKEDIRPFIEHFIDIYNTNFNMHKHFSQSAIDLLTNYEWPGNVRELENMVQRLMLYTGSEHITEDEVLSFCQPIRNQLQNKDDTVSQDFAFNTDDNSAVSSEEAAYKEAACHCRTTREMAKYLNVSQPTVVRRLKKYNIKLK